MSGQINLFNPIFLQQKKIFAARTMAQALGLLTIGALAIAGTAWRSVVDLRRDAADVTLQAARKDARLAGATIEFAPRKASTALAGEVGDAESRLAALRRVARLVQSGELGNTRGYAEQFRALGRQHRDGLWLTGISLGGAGATNGANGTNETSGANGANVALALAGRALDATLVPAYIARLAREPVLRGAAFGDLQITRPATPAALPTVEFTLQAGAAEVKP